MRQLLITLFGLIGFGCHAPAATPRHVQMSTNTAWSAEANNAALTTGPETHSEPNHVTGFERLDDNIEALMREWSLPGGQIAVTFEGRLVHLQHYGRADETSARNVTDETRFRIASLSKSITAVAIHHLISQNRLNLDDRLFSHLANPGQPPHDRRWEQITIRHLLEHSAGFDRHESVDPMFYSNDIAKNLHETGPADFDMIFRYMLRQPLDFTPGQAFAYSNFGYTLLGQVIEAITEMSYARYVEEAVLRPMDIRHMEIGRARPSERPENETAYFAHPEEGFLPSVFPNEGIVAAPDGGFFMAPMAAHGGWIAAARDIARFLVHFDNHSAPEDFLNEAQVASMVATPAHSSFNNRPWHYGHGWFVVPTERGAVWSHDGSKPGTTAMMVRDDNTLTWVALFNSRPIEGDIDEAIEDAFDTGLPRPDNMPSHDLFVTRQP